MKKTIEELWYGDICTNFACHDATVEMEELMKYIENHRNDLQVTFTHKQKEIFEKFYDCCIDLKNITEREIFSYAFRLGARIAIEVMSLDIE